MLLAALVAAALGEAALKTNEGRCMSRKLAIVHIFLNILAVYFPPLFWSSVTTTNVWPNYQNILIQRDRPWWLFWFEFKHKLTRFSPLLWASTIKFLWQILLKQHFILLWSFSSWSYPDGGSLFRFQLWAPEIFLTHSYYSYHNLFLKMTWF